MKIIIIFSLFFTIHANADLTKFKIQNKFETAKSLFVFQQQILQLSMEPANKFSGLIFKQKLDHHSPRDSRTFNQRYWINSSLASGKKAPVVLFLCGEWTCSDSTFYSFYQMIKTLGAHFVTMEHRYYGQSHPFSTLATANLKYLTVDQALEDFAQIQMQIQNEQGLTGPWIVLGASYSATLAAYYRLAYPQLVVGAWASSAPAKAKENFEEYDHHVATVITPECAQSLRVAVKQIEATLDDPQKLAATKKLFNAQEIRNPVDFLYSVADAAAFAVQYGKKDKFCASITSADPLNEYAMAVRDQQSANGLTALTYNPQEAEDLSVKNNTRQWYYQSCTEFGFWQNAYHDGNASARSAKINMDYHHSICQRLFGIDTALNESKINRLYFLRVQDPDLASQIYFSNGSNDPWSKLSITTENNANPKNYAHLIEGAAHCDDMQAPSSDDSPALVEARKITDNLLQSWIKR